MVAAMLELKDFLEEENEFDDDYEEDEEDEEEYIARKPVPPPPAPARNWEKKLGETLALTPRRSTSPNLTWYAAVVLLTRSQLGYSGYGSSARANYYYSLEPLIIKANDWQPLADNRKKSPQEINELLESDKKWIKVANRMFQQVNPAGCLNISPNSASFLNTLSDTMRYGVGTSNLPAFLSLLAKLEIPVFLGSIYPSRLDHRVHILPDPVDIKIDLKQDEHKLTLRTGYEQNGKFIHIQNQIETITHNPAWVMLDDTIAQLRNTSALSMLSSFPIEIPNAQVEIFREQYFARIAQLLPIKGDIVQWQDVHAEPIPRLYLHDNNKDKILRADLRFGYGDHEVSVTKTDEPYTVETVPDSWNLIRVYRNQPARTGCHPPAHRSCLSPQTRRHSLSRGFLRTARPRSSL